MSSTDEGPGNEKDEPIVRASVSDRAASGIPWSLSAYASNRVLTLVTTIVLARLLTPADFGLMALAVLALTILNVLSDVGLTGVLVVRQDLDRREQGTVLTLLLASGVAVALLLVVLAPVAAALFSEPRLTNVLRALAAMAAISGFSWFYDMLVQRELEFRRRFLAQAVRTLVYAAVAILLASLGAGVYSLVAGQLAGVVSFSLALLWLAPYRVLPVFERTAAGKALRTGRGFLLQAGATTVQDNLDYIVVGRVLGTAPLGVYSLAYRLSEVPYSGVADPVARVTFSAFARMRHEQQDVAPVFLRSLRFVALLTWPLGLIMSGAAEPLTRGVFGEQWLAMIGPLSVLGIWAAIRPLETMVGWFLNAMGEATRSGWISTFLLLPLVPALLLGAELGAATGVAWAALGHLVVTVGLQVVVADRRIGVRAVRQARALITLVPAGVGCWVATRVVADATNGAAVEVRLVAAVVVGLLTYLAIVRVFDPALLRTTAQDAKRSLRGPATSAT